MSEAALRYFHGGVPGLKPGDTIFPSPPHVIDGCRVCEARAKGQTATVGGEAIDADIEPQAQIELLRA